MHILFRSLPPYIYIYIYTQFSLHIESIDNTKDKALEPTLIVLLCCIERIHGTECSGPRQV